MTTVYRRSGTQLLARGRPPRTPGPGVAQKLRLHEAAARSIDLSTSDPFVFGTTKPTAANTGPRYSALTTESGTNGKKTITTSQTISRVDFRCQVVLAAGITVTFEDCRFLGSTLTSYVAQSLLVMTGAAACTVRFCEFTAYDAGQDRTRFWLNGITPCNNITVERSNLHDVVDGIAGSGSNWTIRGNYGHDWSFRSDDNDHKSDSRYPWWTHNDFFQPSAGDNQWYMGNSYEGTFSTNSGHYQSTPAGPNGGPTVGQWENAHGLLIGPKSGNLTNIRVELNWWSGGQYPVQMTTQGRGFDTGNNGSLFGNRFYANQWPYNTQVPAQIVYASSIGTFTGIDTSIYAEDDMSIPAGWRGKPIQAPTGSFSYKFNSSLTPPN